MQLGDYLYHESEIPRLYFKHQQHVASKLQFDNLISIEKL